MFFYILYDITNICSCQDIIQHSSLAGMSQLNHESIIHGQPCTYIVKTYHKRLLCKP
ncbi:hypothetical protein CLOBOL_01914 [Enterocloster bolteae ATCC BAA-613]|uniref:Uncharacterized protein n=1 Tax=Enterocloster bolteae (strain ATCC BAA-613 / DSM 15670 / CCUG 46953 / JCM 12243 / WAL 16351) TaxID=411902 RepID=A8RMH9_ENTBW|nr:hypothetical protein CLOBOL_01914 [Enterocloster bolteae ATCC BAA-613]